MSFRLSPSLLEHPQRTPAAYLSPLPAPVKTPDALRCSAGRRFWEYNWSFATPSRCLSPRSAESVLKKSHRKTRTYSEAAHFHMVLDFPAQTVWVCTRSPAGSTVWRLWGTWHGPNRPRRGSHHGALCILPAFDCAAV